MGTNASTHAIKDEWTSARVCTRQTKDDALNLHLAEPRLGRAFRARRGIVALVTSLAALGMCVIPARVADARPISVPCDKQGQGLIDAINLADNGDDVVLDQNCSYVLDKIDNSTDGDNGLPVITKTLTILGHGAIIARKVSGAPEFRILHVRGGHLTLNDVKIEHGVADDHNATPPDNFKKGRGGGIYNLGTLKIIISTFSNNTANFGGGAIGNGDPEEVCAGQPPTCKPASG